MEAALVDLANFDCVAVANDGATVEIKHPVSGQPMGITVTVLGSDSRDFQRATKDHTDLLRARVAKAGGYRAGLVSDDEKDEQQMELLCICTKAWTGIAMNGEAVACTKENAEMLYAKLPWFKEQVEAAILNRANFIKG